MGMVVRTNTMALNAYRQLGMNNSAVAKSLEKLSSGFRINRAGDDAAGLAISEKMKAQIKGLETASANAQDGISLIQTAEGNLSEVHDMLNRMVELATKSANGTYTTTERRALQDEMDQLLTEIDRISQSANFNGTKLLNGTMGLNSEVFDVSAATDAVEAETKVGDDVGTITAANTHYNTGVTQAEKKPAFTVNLADLKWTQKADGITAGVLEWNPASGLSVGGKTVILVADAETSTAAGSTKVESDAAADKDTDLEFTGSDLITKLNLGTTYKHAVVDNEVFEVSGSGSTITFTWVGKVKGGKLDDTAAVDDATVTTSNALIKGNVAVTNPTAKATTGTGTVNTENRDNCHVTVITDAIKATNPNRAGVSLKLTADMLQVGAKLKIGNNVFTFVDKKEADAGTNEIGLKDIGTTDAEKLQAVTRQLSNKSTVVVAKDGKNYNFTLGRGAGTDTIEIEEAVQTDADKYGKFTLDELKAAFEFTTAAQNASRSLTLKDNDKDKLDGSSVSIDGTTYTFSKDGAAGTVQIGANAAATLKNLAAAIGNSATVDTTGSNPKLIVKAANATDNAPAISGGGLTLQIGDTADSYNKMNVAVDDMSTEGLGLNKLKNSGIMTEKDASDAIDKIKKAINTVSSTRAGMGALQNRLEHTINNLDVAAENLSAANSRIRDTDMAKEMMNYTKMNVLVQSAQAMLAQANQQPQSVLQLLQ